MVFFLLTGFDISIAVKIISAQDLTNSDDQCPSLEVLESNEWIGDLLTYTYIEIIHNITMRDTHISLAHSNFLSLSFTIFSFHSL